MALAVTDRLGIAAAVRDAAAAAGVVLGLLCLVRIIATVVGSPSWHRHLEQVAPMTAGLAIQARRSGCATCDGPAPGPARTESDRAR